MEHVKKWASTHKKACLLTGLTGLLLAAFFMAAVFSSNPAVHHLGTADRSRNLFLSISKEGEHE